MIKKNRGIIMFKKKKTKHFYIYFEYPGARLLFNLTYLSIYYFLRI